MTNNSEGYEGEKYDGIDIDWEPLQDNDEYQYIQFITLLRDKLNELNLQNPPLLTAAVKEQPAVFAQLQNQFDQINIMTYDLAGNWDEYRVTWHDAAVYDGDFPRPHEGRFPSADSLVKAFKNAGVPARKLGIGIVFHGKQWRPVTQLLEKWSPDNPPQVEGLPYSEIVSKYYPNGVYHWDSQAQAAYLSHDGWRLTDKYFISYDDETSIQAKIDYLSQNGLGGVIIWELAGGWLPSGTTVRDPLLKAVKNATRWVPI